MAMVKKQLILTTRFSPSIRHGLFCHCSVYFSDWFSDEKAASNQDPGESAAEVSSKHVD
jgi:hypothetical protein